MSGGSLVVMDRAGRDVKRYPLPSGLATLGSDPACDIRFMLPSVSPHHATVVVHTNQCVVRNVGSGETLVNGRAASVAALAHGDTLALGGRRLRWESCAPRRAPAPAPLPQLCVSAASGARGGRVRRASAGGAPAPRDRAAQLSLELAHRASCTGSSGGKQVAIVQPQRRDVADQNERAVRVSGARRAPLLTATKASLWIHSRKAAPRNTAKTGTPASARRPHKILPPDTIDVTKRAALLLMAGRGAPRRPRRHTTPHRHTSHVVLKARASEGTTPHSSRGRPRVRISLRKSPILSSPKKSSLRDPTAKKSTRKTESIKFDLSNLENKDESVLVVSNTTHADTMSEDDLTLHYSDTSKSPSPRVGIHSRSSRILENTLGTSITLSPSKVQESRTLTPELPRRKSRGSTLLQKALANADTNSSTLAPSPSHSESYSIVDLVSIDSSNRSTSVYNSVGSVSSSAFGTPSTRRATRSTIDPTLLGSSTPYVKATRSQSKSNMSSKNSSKLSTDVTPENTLHVSVNSKRVSRRSRSRSRINDSDLMFISGDENEDSPRSSRRSKIQTKAPHGEPANIPEQHAGTSTPETRHSPVEATTPVLNIQSLLDASQRSEPVQKRKRGRPSLLNKRKTIGVISAPKRRSDIKSKSLVMSVRKTRLRLSKDCSESDNTETTADDEVATPTSAVKLVQEQVKNKHSTAKKPQSKRSIIDDLNRSDIVKQLFNSPVKRKLSRSMTEFSRKHLDDDDDLVVLKRPTRNTIALTGRTPDNSLLEQSDAYTPDVFVSPINTPSTSPNLSGIKRLFNNNSPRNDLRNVRGVRSLLRTPRARKSIKNDLTNVSGVKAVFAKSPRNRLSDVRVKRVFAASPKNDLTRVRGVKTLFQAQEQPKNDLSDIRGVKSLFKGSPVNDLRNVSGVKRTLRGSPRNDLRDVSGVGRMFKEAEEHYISGVEELANESRSEMLFDQLVGKPQVRAVYSKTFAKSAPKKATRGTKSLHSSIDMITNNVEEWLEKELQKRLHKHESTKSTPRGRELQNLATSTVEGSEPLRAGRARHSTLRRAASEIYRADTLPIKKRSLERASAPRGPRPPRERLPLKKRAVVHSTPVKGGGALNASELGRVSPIAAADHDTSIRSSQPVEPPEPKPRGRRQTKATITKQTTTKVSEKSPAKSSVLARTTRNRATATLALPELKPSPEKTTKTRKEPSPKNKRAKVVKSTVVITKPSPQLRPKRARKTEPTAKDSPKETRKRSTRATATEIEPKTRGRKTVIVKTDSITSEPKTRGRKTIAKTDSETSEEPITRGRKPTVKANSESSDEPKTRGRKTIIVKANSVSSEEPMRAKRGRKTQAIESTTLETKTRGKKGAQLLSPKAKETRRTRRNTEPEAEEVIDKQVRTRGKHNDTQTQVKQTKRAAKTKVEVLANTRKRKATEDEARRSEDKPSEVTKVTRGKKVVAENETGNTRRGKDAQKGERDSSNNRTVRFTKVVEVPATETRRGKKQTRGEEVPPQEVAKRASKRKTNVDASPVAASKQPAAKRSRRRPASPASPRPTAKTRARGPARRR